MKVFFVLLPGDADGATNVYDFDLDTHSIYDQDSGITLQRVTKDSGNLIITTTTRPKR